MGDDELSRNYIFVLLNTINAVYYIDVSLTKTCLTSLKRTANAGTVLEKKFVQNMSKVVFMQDSAPAHTAIRTQKWCSENLSSFWSKKQWPGNSPGLNPIKNLGSILKSRLEESEPVDRLETLKIQLKRVWSEIEPNLLESLVSGKPDRIRKCIHCTYGRGLY